MGKERRRRPKNQLYSEELMRTRPERDAEVKKIMRTLTDLGLTADYSAVKELLPILAVYAKTGERTCVDIPVPEADRRMVGVLAASKREEVWLRLEKCA